MRVKVRVEALEDRWVPTGISSVIEYPVPTAGSDPNFITTGPDGNVWFTESGTGAIGEINASTKVVTSYPVTSLGKLWGITAGPNGNLWFTDYDSIVGEINPTTHAISTFTVPNGNGLGSPRQITADSDGNLWFTMLDGRGIGEINATTDAISEYTMPASCGEIFSIATGPDGNIWFGSIGTTALGMINPTTHAVSTFALPGGLMGMTAGPDGNVWFTNQAESGNYVGMINPTTDVITQFPTAGSPFGITAGSDGNVWFTENGTSASQIASINPSTGVIAQHPLASGEDAGRITSGPDGNLWYADPADNSIGVAALTSNQFVVTAEPPSSVTAGAPFGLTVQAEDASGNLLASFNGTVTLALAGGGALGGTLTANAVNGVATFSGLSLTEAGSGYVIDASASGVGIGATTAISVTPAAPTQLLITTEPPSSVRHGTGFGFVVVITDAYGNVETSDNATVTVALGKNPGGAALGGTATVPANNGVATFTGLKISKAGKGYTLVVTSPGLASATSTAVNVS